MFHDDDTITDAKIEKNINRNNFNFNCGKNDNKHPMNINYLLYERRSAVTNLSVSPNMDLNIAYIHGGTINNYKYNYNENKANYLQLTNKK